ncbi:Down syndrome cell adhesion molecule-like protein 1-like protein, partial [Leptotrombidium deliense]
MITLCIFIIIQLNLVFATPPNIMPMLQTITEIEGKPARMMCAAYGEQPLIFEWKKDGQKVSDRTNLKVITNKDDTILQFSSLKLTDSGNYTCVVMNAYGQQSQRVSLIIKAPVKWIKEPTNARFKIGEIGYLECEAEGSPSPLVTWKGKGNRTLSNTGRLDFGEVSIKDV